MTVFYLDTSAIVKRYALEIGTPWITSLLSPQNAHDVYTLRLAGPEMVAAITRKLRQREISQEEAARAAFAFRQDWQTRYQIVEATPTIADQAMLLAEKYGLRAYDAMHVAAALALQTVRDSMGLPALTFVSADEQQLAAATHEHLRVENPNTRP